MVTKSNPAAWFGAAAGEADFAALYRAELPRVYNFFRYRRDLAAFSAWLFTIARRVAVDHYRRRRPALPLDALAHSFLYGRRSVERCERGRRARGLGPPVASKRL